MDVHDVHDQLHLIPRFVYTKTVDNFGEQNNGHVGKTMSLTIPQSSQ